MNEGVENQAEASSRSKVEDMAWIEEALAGGQNAMKADEKITSISITRLQDDL